MHPASQCVVQEIWIVNPPSQNNLDDGIRDKNATLHPPESDETLGRPGMRDC